MELSIVPQAPEIHVGGAHVLFKALDRAKRRLTVAVLLDDWALIEQRCAGREIAEVQHLARSGRWVALGDRKVWHCERG